MRWPRPRVPRYLSLPGRGTRPDRRVLLRDGVLRVGAQPGVDLVLADPTVSRIHCEIRYVGGRVTVRDLGSKNGVLIQGVRVPEGELGVGQTLQLGRVELRLLDGPVDDDLGSDEVLPGVVGGSPAMRALAQQVRQLAGSDLGVLVTGETGTGKELVARLLHDLGPRRDGPFVPLNCGALPADLIEAELFGHERGAFTGAAAAREGLFEAAAGGTLFLDELGELPLSQQPKLLRALESRRVRRLGSPRDRFVDVRLVAATHASVERRVAEGRFRRDLLYRISEATLRIPPLSERREDIPLLLRHFAEEVRRDESLPDPPPLGPHRLEEVQGLALAGNVRELRSLVRRAAVLGWAEALRARPRTLAAPSSSADERLFATVSQVAEPREPYPVALPELERNLILEAYEQARGNKSRAARLLGMAKSTYADRLNRLLAAQARSERAGDR